MLNTSLQLAYACAHTCTYINDFGPMMHSPNIKTHGSESRGQEEAACMRVFWPTRPLQ